ncbi:MAG: hypothetical protein IJ466_11095 [Clostridia bacterium]|nr:hypothetical protein [Clostridia bacterium]
MPYKQDPQSIEAWQKENVERITIKPNKKKHITERIQLAIDMGVAKNRQNYIVEAILKQLDADGIPEIEE